MADSARSRTAREVSHLFTTARAVDRALGGVFAEEDVRLDSWRILNALAAERGMSMVSVARSLLLSAPTVSRLVDELDELGLVYRRAAPTDGRVIVVHISRAGALKLTRIEAAIDARLGSRTVSAGHMFSIDC